MDYTGYVDVKLSEDKLAEFYETGKCAYETLENEYLIVRNADNEIVDKQVKQNGKFHKIKFPTIDSFFMGKIKPRNTYQQLAMDLLSDRNVPVKIIRGVFGSGKDFLMSACALELIRKGTFNKIVYIRPNVTVKNVPDVGFLPGDAFEKLAWTLGPLLDKVGGEEGIKSMITKEQLELVPLPFIRGRSFDNSIIYVSECQNITTDVFKLIISRVGENSELWVNADNKQVDKQIFSEDNGVQHAINRLKGNKLFGYVYLPITERGAVANLANILDE